MVSKRDLGVGYLIAVGIALFGALTSGLLWPADSSIILTTPNAVMALLTGLTVAGGFTLSGIGLANSKLAADRVWRVALWSTVGLGVPTMLVILLAVFYREALAGLGWRSIAMINIAGGGVVGILVGMITELRAEHDQTVALNQRNTVFLRLFRHDIRNSVTSMLGHIDLIEEEDTSSARSFEVVRNCIDHIAKMSDAARQLDDLGSDTREEPMDLVAIVLAQLEDLQATYPNVVFETDLPPDALVSANYLLSSVVENLLRNAIEHNNAHPVVRVSITAIDLPSRSVQLQIEDNGPGLSENELFVHTGANETALRHSDGIGLWLSRWIVDSFDGEFSVDNTERAGAVITVKLPAA